MTKIEELWEYACSGNIKALEEYEHSLKLKDKDLLYEDNYKAFGREHSFIMGALRNNQFETVDWLLDYGCEITQQEKTEMENELKRIKYMKKLCDL